MFKLSTGFLRSRVFGIPLLVTVCAGILSFIINGFTIHVWNGVDVLLGVPFAILVAAWYGPVCGGLAAAIGSSRTIILWRHPYAFVIYVIESLAVGTLVRRGAPVAVASLLFWSCAGIPFVFFCYTAVLGLSTQFALMIAVTDCLAGLFGAAFVHLVGMPNILRPVWRWLRVKPNAPSLRADVFTVMILMGTLPLAVLLGYDGYYLRQQREEEAKVFLRSAAAVGTSCLERMRADQDVRLSLILREFGKRRGHGGPSLDAFALPGETLLLEQGGARSFTVSTDSSGEFIRILQAHASSDGVASVKLVSDRVFPRIDFCPLFEGPSPGWRILVFTEDLALRGTLWGAKDPKARLPEPSLIRDLQVELGARKAVGPRAISFEFQKSGPDAFRRGRYLVATRLTESGLLVVAYQPASAAARGVAEFQQLTIFWLVVSAIISVLFAHGSISRILGPLATLAEHFSRMKLAQLTPVPRPSFLPVELEPIWKGAAETQRRLGQSLSEISEAAERANRATKQKSDFLATISHEIRTPLNCILGMLPAAAKGQLTPRQQEALGMMRRSGEHLLHLINDVLDFSKIESGAISIRPQRTELLPFLDECFLMLKPTARSKKLFFWWHFEGKFPKTVLCDGTRLRQILFNIAGNAIKFTSNGEVFITVCTRKEGAGSALVVTVTDTGPGIDTASLESVFAPFSQLAVPVGSVEFAGAGLGLAICRQLLDLMEGSISISSAPGTGTRVRIRVPISQVGEEEFRVPEPQKARDIILAGPPTEIRACLLDHFRLLGKVAKTVDTAAEIEAADADNTAIVADESILGGALEFAAKLTAIYPGVSRRVSGWAAESPESFGDIDYCWPPSLERLGEILALSPDRSMPRHVASSPHRGPESNFPLQILVAEDNLESRIVAELLLQELGYSPKLVSDGEAAVTAMRSADFDLCLIDLRMPKMDGIAVVQQIRAERKDSAPFLTALTASAFTEDRELCLRAGFDAFLSKPIREDVLRDLIRSRVVPVTLEKFKAQAMDMEVHHSFVSLLSKAGPDLAEVKASQILDEIAGWIPKAVAGMPAAARTEAHRRAGSASLIGASRLATVLGRMERIADAGDEIAWKVEAQRLPHLLAQTRAVVSLESSNS